MMLFAVVLSPLQDWDGNTTEIDADRVLVLCAVLILSLIGNLISMGFLFPIRNRNGIAAALLVVQAVLITTTVILAAAKWFPHYEG